MTDKANRHIRWGIIGCGSIATHAIAPAMNWSPLCDLVAIASRDAEKAAAKARETGARRSYGSYAELLADPEIDAVYIGLPNGLHEEWTLKAAKAGKHVLCEKSLSLSSTSVRTMIAACEKAGVRLMEAYMYRHHPQWDVVRGAIKEGKLGEVRLVRAGLCGMLQETGDHRWSATLGGGALYDVTCYAINVSRMIYGREPVSVLAMADTSAREKVDVTSTALLNFGHNRLAVATGSLGTFNSQHCEIEGTRGRITVERPFIPGWEEAAVVIEYGMTRDRVRVGGANHFLHQLEHFSLCVIDPKRPIGPGEVGLQQQLVNEAVEQSWISGKTVEVMEA